MYIMTPLLFWIFFFLMLPIIIASSLSLQSTDTPPLLDSPVFSLATQNLANDDKDDPRDGTTAPPATIRSTNMNILTYATPVSVRPKRVWSIGLFKDTLSYENFARERQGILQLLSYDHHVPVVRLLGGRSGRDVDKQRACADLGCAWIDLDGEDFAVLPHCVSYVKLSLMGELIDAGSHAVAACQVERMYEECTITESTTNKSQHHLSTAKLRELGIITEQGRIADVS